MVVGNIAALVQTSVKRLLAYSAIAHGGYALLAFFGNPRQMLPALFFYVITYALTVLGAFAVVAVVENSGSRDRLADWAGLGRRAPLLSACMFVFMLSLAGIPPLSGFFGKFYLFTAATAGAPHSGHALARHRGGRRQRDFALLLSASAQTDLHRRAFPPAPRRFARPMPRWCPSRSWPVSSSPWVARPAGCWENFPLS